MNFFVLNQRLSEGWCLDVTLDKDILRNVLEQWDTLAAAAKINVLCIFLGVRSKDLWDEMALILKRALEDSEDWVQCTAKIVEPLLVKDVPEQVTLEGDVEFQSAIEEIGSFLSIYGPPEWRPSFEAYISSSHNDHASKRRRENSFFQVKPGKEVKPLVPSSDADNLKASTQGSSMPQSGSVQLYVSKTAPSSSFASTSSQDRRGVGAMRSGNSLLGEKKSYRPKRTVQKMSLEQHKKLMDTEQKTPTVLAEPLKKQKTDEEEQQQQASQTDGFIQQKYMQLPSAPQDDREPEETLGLDSLTTNFPTQHAAPEADLDTLTSNFQEEEKK